MLGAPCFLSRCQRLSAQLQPQSVAILQAAPMRQRGWDTRYPFWQDSDFYYLCGFNEPDAILLVFSADLGSKRVLFCKPADPVQAQWEGACLGVDRAQAFFDQALSLDDLKKHLPDYLSDVLHVYCSLGERGPVADEIDTTITQFRSGLRRGKNPIESCNDLRLLTRTMRLIKDEAEVGAIQVAIDHSIGAHVACMHHCRPGMYEYELEALFYQQVRQAGCDCLLAYDSIVGGAERACILHYTANNALLAHGDMVLIDAGAAFQHYAADITRTYPVNGRFSRDQAALYQAVLDVQLMVIEAIKPGVNFNYLQQLTRYLLTEQLLDLGLLHGDVDALVTQNACQAFYPLGVGHWLGLDVHDPCPLKDKQGWLKFKPGMVLTIEPGLYIAPGHPSVDRRWWGMGVRIEDDVLVTETGCQVLSSAMPKHRSDIEALMTGAI